MLTQSELDITSSWTFLNLVTTPPSFVWGTLGFPPSPLGPQES